MLDGSASLRHVQSIKDMSSHLTSVPNTTTPASLRSPIALELSAESQNLNQGEGFGVPEHTTYGDLASGIMKLRADTEAIFAEPRIRETVLKALAKAKAATEGEIEAKQLSKGKKQKGNVDTANIVKGKRKKPPESVNAESQRTVKHAKKNQGNVDKNVSGQRRGEFRFQLGDGISVKAKLFDGSNPGSFSKDHPG